MSTGVFLSISANARPPSSQQIPTKPTSSPISSYLTLVLRFNPTPTFLGDTFDRTLSFSKHAFLLKVKFFHVSKSYAVSLLPHGAPLSSLSLFCIKLFFGLFSLMLHSDGFLFLSVTNITKLERFHQAASHTITGCLSSSPIPLLLYLPYESP